MSRGPRRAAVCAMSLGAWLAAAGGARAQVADSTPILTAPAPELESLPAPAPVRRPRLSLAVGMGVTFDSAGFGSGTAHAIPAFFGVGGFGDGLLGVDLGAFSSAASGRFHGGDDLPIDRLALDAFGVLRPAARFRPDGTRYRMRVLHTLAAEVGLGLERDGRTTGSGSRFQVHTGARLELPLTPAGLPSELRLRLAFRRAIGLYTPVLAGGTATDVTRVGDSTEIYAALATVF